MEEKVKTRWSQSIVDLGFSIWEYNKNIRQILHAVGSKFYQAQFT